MEYVLSIIGLPQYSLKRVLSPFGDFAAHVYDHFIPHAGNNYHPHLLGHRSLALMSGLLVAVKIFTFGMLALGPVEYAFSSAITEENIINLTNQSRSQFQLAGLTQNLQLDKAAQDKANDMLSKGYFAHVTPDGRTPWSFITAAGYNYLMAGENLAVNFTEAENVETAWMNSPGHKANILNKNFENIGIGIAQGQYQGHTAIFVVQEFGTPVEQKITLSNTPTPVQSAAAPPPAAKTIPVKALVQSKTSVLPASTGNPAPTQAAATSPLAPEPVSLEDGQVKLDGGQVNITAKVNGPANKVLAYFGQQAIMLEPKSGGQWSGQVAAKLLAQSNTTVRLEAFGMQGQLGQLQLADFSRSTRDNYNLSGSAPKSYVSFLNRTFNPNTAENRFYLFFIAGLLSSLVLAIGVKRHVQHLSLIANSSFVVILACLLWMGG